MGHNLFAAARDFCRAYGHSDSYSFAGGVFFDGSFVQEVDPSGRCCDDFGLNCAVNIVAHVQDGSTGAPIAGATVNFAPAGTLTTDDNGNCTATLAPDNYTVTASANGYATRTIPLDVHDPQTITIALDPA
jgi:hypothetical protein